MTFQDPWAEALDETQDPGEPDDGLGALAGEEPCLAQAFPGLRACPEGRAAARRLIQVEISSSSVRLLHDVPVCLECSNLRRDVASRGWRELDREIVRAAIPLDWEGEDDELLPLLRRLNAVAEVMEL